MSLRGTLLRYITGAILTLLALGIAPAGCFTGVESTPRITGNDVKRESLPTRADAVSDSLSNRLNALHGEPPAHWRNGKSFIITDSRLTRRLMEVPQPPEISPGDTLIYTGMRGATDVTADTLTILSFTVKGFPVQMRINRSPAQLTRQPYLRIPMTVETTLLHRADSLLAPLKGANSYTLTSNWLDTETAEPSGGRRYATVRYLGVCPGTGVYPLRLLFAEVREDGTGREFCLLTDATAMTNPSRSLSSMLATRNPRLNYPQISDRHWQMIAQGQIEKGMSRDECRLALGTPDDVKREGTTDKIIEVWTYEGGSYLIFENDMLQRFRR